MGKRLAFFFLIVCLAGAAGFSQETEDDIAPDWVLDVNPLMWILSGLANENNNRSVYYDLGIQYNLNSFFALKVNPAISVGFTKETAFSNAQVRFLEVQIPVGFQCFPITNVPAFFAISLTPGVYCTFDDGDAVTFVSIGALVEIGYQLKLANHLVFTPSVGVARIFPLPLQDGAYDTPHYTLYSPWPMDTAVSPRIRLALGFWI
jgi:hypothetical protein